MQPSLRSSLDRRESRRKQLEENERVIRRYSIVSEANALKSIPEDLYLKHFQHLLSEFDVTKKLLRGIRGKEADELYQLGKDNMEELYNQCSWKWNIKHEQKECRSKTARFVIIRERITDKLAAFLEMKLILDDDDDSLVLYIYSIQVNKEFQSRGLGFCLMSFAYDFAKYCKLEKCRLTVFKHNPRALHFYLSKCTYSIDKISPSQCDKDISYNNSYFRKQNNSSRVPSFVRLL